MNLYFLKILIRFCLVTLLNFVKINVFMYFMKFFRKLLRMMSFGLIFEGLKDFMRIKAI